MLSRMLYEILIPPKDQQDFSPDDLYKLFSGSKAVKYNTTPSDYMKELQNALSAIGIDRDYAIKMRQHYMV